MNDSQGRTTPVDDASSELSSSQLAILQLSVLVVALCGIVYELTIATISSYLLGNSVYQFSITIGLFMFAMGLGSYLTRLMTNDLVARFVIIEIAISLAGGMSSVLLFVVFPFGTLYAPVMYTLIIVIGVLVGLEIPILTRVLSRTGGLRQSIANVLSLDYFGALIGSVAFPLLLLPLLGLFRSSFAIGLLNVAVAALNIVVFSKLFRRPAMLGIVTGVVGGLLVAGMVFASVITSYAEGQLFSDRIIYTQQTPYQRIILTQEESTGQHRLYLDGHIQFCERDEYRYHEALVHPIMSIPGVRRQVLILGGGDGLGAREVLKYDDVETIDIVDIDPAMTDLCRTFPALRRLNGDSLRNPKVAIHNTDAFDFVRKTSRKFDRVIVDFPDPHNEALGKLYSVEFFKLLRRCMSDDATFVTQSSSPFVTPEVFWSIAKTIGAAGMDPYSYQVQVPSFGGWGFTLASSHGVTPTEFKLTVDTRFLTNEVMAQAGVFGKDERFEDGVVNSIFAPRLYTLYLKGVNR